MPHAISLKCFAIGVPFVIAVDQILSNTMASTEYGEFYKKCLTDRVVGAVPTYVFENTMLCALMCCCNKHPAQGSKLKDTPNTGGDAPRVEGASESQPERLQLYQTCVKDILDGANVLKGLLDVIPTGKDRITELKKHSMDELRKKLKVRSHIPTTRFIAEPDLNFTHMRVGRGRMNPGGLRRMPGDTVIRPDIGILDDFSDLYGGRKGDIETEGGFKRFVEMKFPTESNDPKMHKEQLKTYRSLGKPVTLMVTGTGSTPDNVLEAPTSVWYCNCSGAPEEVMQPDEGYNPQEKFDHNVEMFNLGLELLLKRFPLGKLGKLPKIGGTVGTPIPSPF